jgi:hypothetical protein
LDQCLYQSTKNPVFCEKCQYIQKDWTIYNAIHENNQEYKQQIQLEKEKVIPIDKLIRNNIQSPLSTANLDIVNNTI